MFEDPKGRREFLTLMGASLALAGLTACTKQPEEKILPYVRQPEELVPGPAALLRDRRRPRRLRARHPRREPRGPADQGRGQPRPPGEPRRDRRLRPGPRARPLRPRPLEDRALPRRGPDLGRLPRRAARARSRSRRRRAGAGLRFLTGRVTSPTLAAQMAGVLAAFPQAKWVSWEPAGRDNARAGAVLAFGEPVEAQYRFDQADVVLSLEADFVASHPASLRLVREFAARRKVERREAGDEPALRGRGLAHADRRLRRPPPGRCAAPRSRASPARWRRAWASPVEGGVDHAWVAPIVEGPEARRAPGRS